MPTACAPTPRRERSSVARATLKPWSTSPIRFSAGTRTSVKTGEPVGEPRIPSLSSFLPIVRPSRSDSTMKARDALGARCLGVGLREDHVVVGHAEVGDPVLLAVDHPLVAVALGAGAHAAGVGAGGGLGERERAGPLAAREPRQDALLLLVGAEELDRQRAELLHHQHQGGRRARARDLLDGDVQHQRAGAGAAVLLVEGQAEEIVLGEQLAQVPGVLGLLVDLLRPRGHARLHHFADGSAQRFEVFGDVVEVVHRRAYWRVAPLWASRGEWYSR